MTNFDPVSLGIMWDRLCRSPTNPDRAGQDLLLNHVREATTFLWCSSIPEANLWPRDLRVPSFTGTAPERCATCLKFPGEDP